MKNFIFKSTETDLQKMFQYLETLQKNVLYITHRVDWLIKEVKKTGINDNLQQQVDKYFEEDIEHIPDESKE